MFATAGNWVSPREHHIVAEIRRLYGERVKVQKFEHRDFLVVIKHPYRIMQWVQSETHPNGGFYEPLFGVDELDQRVLFQLDQFDNYKGWRALSLLDRWEEEQERRVREQEIAWEDEAAELVAAAFKNDRSFTFKNEQGNLVKLGG